MTAAIRQTLALALRDLAVRRTYRASLALGVLSGLAGLASYLFISRLVAPAAPALEGLGYFAFVCTGVGLLGMVAASIGAISGAFAKDANEGTLEAALASGLAPGALVAGSALAPTLLASLQALLCLAAAVALGGVDATRARSGPAALAILLTLLACAPIGLIGAAVWLRVRRAAPIVALGSFGLAFLGGVYFPAALLPAPVQALAWLSPLGPGLEVLRGSLVAGAGFRDSAPALLRLALLACVGLPFGAACLSRALRDARRRGGLALV